MQEILKSLDHLQKYLAENKTLTFSSSPRKLKRRHVLLQSLATGDFNPAHINTGLNNYSIFKGDVSQGIGTIGRAEGAFVQLFQFREKPVELIAFGMKHGWDYQKPLYVGNTYQYTYTISNLRNHRDNLWKFDCHIVCHNLTTSKVVVEWDWVPGLVDHSHEYTPAALQTFRPRSYWKSIYQTLILPELRTGLIVLAIAVFAFVLVFGPQYIGTHWLGADPANSSVIYYSASDSTYYFGALMPL
jgi:acyl dehydratase